MRGQMNLVFVLYMEGVDYTLGGGAKGKRKKKRLARANKANDLV
jgi:hypothetical protein